jgi:hypothetical protein
MGITGYRIKKFDVRGISTFFALTGFVWGVMAGILLFASYLQGYMTNGEVNLLGSGLLGFALMIVYGVAGGFIGGAIIAVLYNKVLGAAYGIRMELAAGSDPILPVGRDSGGPAGIKKR